MTSVALERNRTTEGEAEQGPGDDRSQQAKHDRELTTMGIARFWPSNEISIRIPRPNKEIIIERRTSSPVLLYPESQGLRGRFVLLNGEPNPFWTRIFRCRVS